MLLSARAISKRYQRAEVSVDALVHLDLDVQERDFVTLTGPSGSGKTTLLLILAGLLRPSTGEIQFRGRQIEGLSDAAWASFRREELGFVMQNFSLVPYLSALKNVALPMALSGIPKDQRMDRAKALLARVDLADRDDHLPRELSAGQQQRVAIARALANEPSLVLADEPTGNLDPALAKDVLALLATLNREDGTAVLMVTHSPEAAAVGNARVHLEAGRVVPADAPSASA